MLLYEPTVILQLLRCYNHEPERDTDIQISCIIESRGARTKIVLVLATYILRYFITSIKRICVRKRSFLHQAHLQTQLKCSDSQLIRWRHCAQNRIH
jgi:hypothetical protein